MQVDNASIWRPTPVPPPCLPPTHWMRIGYCSMFSVYLGYKCIVVPWLLTRTWETMQCSCGGVSPFSPMFSHSSGDNPLNYISNYQIPGPTIRIYTPASGGAFRGCKTYNGHTVSPWKAPESSVRTVKWLPGFLIGAQIPLFISSAEDTYMYDITKIYMDTDPVGPKRGRRRSRDLPGSSSKGQKPFRRAPGACFGR